MADAWGKLAKRAGKKFDAAKKLAKEGGAGNPKVEDGRYIAQLVGLELGQSSAGRDQIARDFKIIEGELKGEKLRDYQGLDTEKGISFFMRDLARLGYEEPDGLEDCGPIVEEINKEKPQVRISVKNNGEFQNVFIDKALSSDEVADGTEEGAEAASDEEVEIEVGMTVVAKVDGEEVTGKVVKILEDQGKIKIETEDGEVVRVPVDDVSLPEKGDDDDDEKDDKDGKVDLEDMDRKELEELIDEKDLDVNPKKFKDDDDLREAIEDALKPSKPKKDEDDDADDKPAKKVTKKTGSLKKK